MSVHWKDVSTLDRCHFIGYVDALDRCQYIGYASVFVGRGPHEGVTWESMTLW